MDRVDKSELPVTDQRMLDFMDYCVANNVEGITSRVGFLKMIGFNPVNMSGLERGERGFSKDQLRRTGEIFGVSMDYLFGFSNERYRQTKKASPIEQLESAVALIKMELRNQKPSIKKSNTSK